MGVATVITILAFMCVSLCRVLLLECVSVATGMTIRVFMAVSVCNVCVLWQPTLTSKHEQSRRSDFPIRSAGFYVFGVHTLGSLMIFST